MFIDTHCHLTYPPLVDKLEEIIQRALQAKVSQIICIGTDLDSSEQCLAIAERYPQVWAAVGIHPNDALAAPSNWESVLTDLLSHPKVVAVGEIGLDYYWKNTPRDTQLEFLRRQIRIGQAHNKPLILHNRQADTDLQSVLNECGYYQGVLHCFSSSAEFATQMLELGLYISFTGSVTYGSKHTKAALLSVPLDRLLLETDAPFLTPVALKPRPNEPAFLSTIAAYIADWLALDTEKLAAQTSQNAARLFSLPE